MTSVEVPYSIASALPSLTVLDITNEIRRELNTSGQESGIAYVSPLDEVALVLRGLASFVFDELGEIEVARENVSFRLPREVTSTAL